MKESVKAIDVQAYTCRTQDLNQIIDSLNQDQLKFYQFYNTDIDPSMNAFFKHQNSFKNLDDKFWDSKKLNKTYYDIETKFDPHKAPDAKTAEFPITSIALYNNIENQAFILFLKDSEHKYSKESLLKEIWDHYNDACQKNSTYLIEDLKIEVEIFNSEIELIKRFFLLVKELETLFLIGFNSALFDDPYTVNRAFKLLGESAEYYITDFTLKRYGDFGIEQADYMRADVLKLYKPVDQGGMGMGSSLPSYKLDFIAEAELGINKLELEGNFNEVYKNNPGRFAAYNLLDVILTYKLDEKLQFLEQIYSLAKYNNASVRGTLMGRSFIFNYRNTYHYYVDENLLIRNNKFNKEIYYNPFEK